MGFAIAVKAIRFNWGRAERGLDLGLEGTSFRFLLPKGTGLTPSKDLFPNTKPYAPPIKAAIIIKTASTDTYPEDFRSFLFGFESISVVVSVIQI